MDNSVRKRNGAIIWTAAVILITFINGFSLGTISTSTNQGSIVQGIEFSMVYLLFSSAILGIIFVFYMVGIVFKKLMTTRSAPLAQAEAQTETRTVNPTPAPVYNVDQLIRQLTLGDQQAKYRAALALKEIKQPLMQKILLVSIAEYRTYQRVMSNYNSQIRLSPYGSASWVIGYEIGQKLTDNVLKNNFINQEKRWMSTLEGAKYYLYYSCDSLEAGILELIRVIIENSNYQEMVEQGQYVIKYIGVTLVEPLIKLFDNPHPEIRAGSILLLAALDDIRSYDPIRKGLKDPSQMVRDTAATVIKQINIPLEPATQKEVIKEIVKIPCKYCGTYIENTATYCPSCGAPLNK